jgi:hypothetical protein
MKLSKKDQEDLKRRVVLMQKEGSRVQVHMSLTAGKLLNLLHCFSAYAAAGSILGGEMSKLLEDACQEAGIDPNTF